MVKINNLFIAEKPSLAEAIASARAEQTKTTATKSDGAWIVGNDRVTWFYGHMYGLAEPKEYGDKWASWSLDNLPIVIEDGKWKLTVNDGKKDHIVKIAAMVREASTIINCGDPAREGQLLIDEALLEMKVDPFGDNVKRLWVQSMTRRDMLVALDNMIDNKKKKPLYNAAVCRQRADWQHGMTFSRLYTILANKSGADVKISVGRVQTPTLRIIVDRDKERANFRPKDYFVPIFLFRHAKGTFTATWVAGEESQGLDAERRLVDRNVADAIVLKIIGKQGKITEFTSEIKTKAPPLPYSLSALQSHAGSKFGLTAKNVLTIAQTLYESKLTTYPRTDSRYLPVSILTDESGKIMAGLGKLDNMGSAVAGANMSIKSSAWNDAKITDHHAILPTTEVTPAKIAALGEMERKVFYMIAESFIIQFYQPTKWRALTANITCGGENFVARGRQTIELGWKRVYEEDKEQQEQQEKEEEESSQSLPEMAKGDSVKAEGGEAASKKTTPPPAFTDPTLINAMANIHRFVSDQEIKKRLKENDGLGTEATRAEIIETLIRREFIKRKGKNTIESTDIGKSVIDALPEELKDPGLTAIWEKVLKKIEGGDYSPEKFINTQIKTIHEWVEDWKKSNIKISLGERKKIEGEGEQCPQCRKNVMVARYIHKGTHKGKVFLTCSGYPDCAYRAWPQPKIPPAMGHGKQCPECQKGILITKQIVAKKDKKKYIILTCSTYPDCRHSEWPERPSVEPLPNDGKLCSKCNSPMKTRMISKDGPNKGKRFLSCTNAECKHYEFPEDDIGKLKGDGDKCEKCDKGIMRTRKLKGRDGKINILLACDNYPECRNIRNTIKKQ